MILWVYGLSTSVTLVSVWGRSVVGDPQAVGAVAREAATSQVLVDRLIGRLDLTVGSAFGNDPRAAEVLDAVVARPEFAEAMRQLVGDMVTAATLPAGQEAVVKPSDALMVLAPVVVEESTALGTPVPEPLVVAGIESLGPITVKSTEQPPLIGRASPTARALTMATGVGAMVMGIAGAVAVLMSDDRRKMFRSLLNRIAISALSFTVMLRVGAWVADPGGGKAPLRSAFSVLVSTRWWLPAVIAGVAGALSWMWRRRRNGRDTADVVDPVETVAV